MNFVLKMFDGLGNFFSELSSRIEGLLSERNKIRFLWILIGILFVFGVADNRTAVEKIWASTGGQSAIFNEAGELVQASLNGAIAWISSLTLTIFFWVCEANLILGVRDPGEAHERFKEANQFRVEAADDSAPKSAEHYYSALMNGELFDIRIAKAVGVIAFVFDIAIQWQNREWNGSNIDIMISAVFALLMLVGTELLMVLTRVIKRRSYPAEPTQRMSRGGEWS